MNKLLIKLFISLFVFLLMSPAFAGPTGKDLSTPGAPFTGPVAPAITKPCDIYAAAGTPCVAAHSLIRRIRSQYTGPLFQVQRSSDSTTILAYAGVSGLVNTPPLMTFCAQSICRVSLIYDQMHTAASGNNLPQSTFSSMGTLAFVPSQFGPLPELVINAFEYYRNRTATVGIPTGNASTTEYMLVDTNNSGSACCSTYGNVEATVADTGNGHMFGLAYATGAAGTFGSGTGPWAGVDWENGVYMYGPTITGSIQTILGKYNQPGNAWKMKAASAQQNYLATTFSGAPPYTAAFEGGISLGEGGDSSPAPVTFFEGAILASYSSDTSDDAVQAGINQIFSGINNSPAPSTCNANDLATNLVVGPLAPTSNFTNSASAVLTAGTDPLGGSTALTVTGPGSQYAAAFQTAVPIIGGMTYTFTDTIKATTSATVFPGVSLLFNSSGSPEYAAVINTNNASSTIGRWGTGDALKIVTQYSPIASGWISVKLIIQAPIGATSTFVYLTPPIANTAGQRSNQTGGLATTHYCPLLRAGAF